MDKKNIALMFGILIILLIGCVPKENMTDASSDSLYADFVRPSKAQLKDILTDMQFLVTQEDGTEPPFDNEYWDKIEDGIYVDIISGEPLFSSKDQFISKSGWPSFTKPLEPENIVEKIDYKLIVPRVEIRSRYADSHLGHRFDDGPLPTGLRFCMNSAALRFIPKDDLETEGYGKYSYLFT